METILLVYTLVVHNYGIEMGINTVTETNPLTFPPTAAKCGFATGMRTEMETRLQLYSLMTRNNGGEMGNYTATKAPLLFGQLAYKSGGMTENVVVNEDNICVDRVWCKNGGLNRV